MSKTFTTRQQMYHDLMVAYRKVVKEHDCQDQSEAFYRTVNQPAPRFYVCPLWAEYLIGPMFSGDESRIAHMKPLHKEMYRDLFKEALKLSSKLQFQGKSLHYIMPFAVRRPAPRFYVCAHLLYRVFKDRKKYDKRFDRFIKKPDAEG